MVIHKEKLSDVPCPKLGLLFLGSFAILHMLVAAGDPLLDSAYWACHNLFGVNVFYEHVKLRIAACLFENLVHCCLKLAAVFLLRSDVRGAGVHSVSSKS